MSTNNQTGKVRVKCSCGTKAALDVGDIQRWQYAHALTNPAVKHDIQADPEDVIGVGENW